MVTAETTKSPEPLAAFSKIPEEAASYESVCWQPCSLRTRLGTEAFRESELGWKQETLAALGSTRPFQLGPQRSHAMVRPVGSVVPSCVLQHHLLGHTSNHVPELLLGARHGPDLMELRLVGSLGL